MSEIDITKYKAVFFDVGGTLLRVHPSVGDVYAHYSKVYGFSGTAQELNFRFGTEWKKMGGMESLGATKGVEAEKKFWSDLVYKVFEMSGGLRDFDEFFECVYDAFRSKEHWRVFEDVLDSGILQHLKSRGVKLGVVSNWDSRLPQILGSMELAQYFDFILASTVIGSAKPDSFIFEEAIRLSGFSPGEACHIGDEIKADYHGARQVGIDSIIIDRKETHQKDIVTIKSFNELITP
ncbi:MAG: HAD-IA family hydrolase [Nitrospinales bacterium]